MESAKESAASSKGSSASPRTSKTAQNRTQNSTSDPTLTFITTVIIPLAVLATLVFGLVKIPAFHRQVVRFSGNQLPMPLATWLESKILIPLAMWKETGVPPGDRQCLERRMILDDFIGEAECDALIRLADLKRTGDLEKRSDVGLAEIEELRDRMSLHDVRILNETRLRMLEIVWRNLSPPPGEQLYFEKSLLKLRTPDNEPNSREIFGDLCSDSVDGNPCLEEPTWRSRSALLYLDDAPEASGGEFMFAGTEDCGEKDLVPFPKCGLLVAFTAGDGNRHSLLRVESGVRRTLEVAFAVDSDRAEPEFK